MPNGTTEYPVKLSIEYPEKCDRLTTFFRFFVAIPILIILAMLMGYTGNDSERHRWMLYGYGVGVVFLPVLLMILFNKKYPRWWFDWNVALVKFAARIESYLNLLTHEYPSTDEEQRVHIEIPYPDVQNELGRGMPLIKWLLVLPHVIVLSFLYIAAVVCVIIAWFAILFSEKYPVDLFNFVVGVMRWGLRVYAYAVLLTTDIYPPFTLSE
ncbi:MAG: DUF4389 domain-containing protein [bacterium]|jgi:hypothetical protein